MRKNDFLLSTYSDILETALKNDYCFIPYERIGREESPRSCLLRHDIDSELLGCEPMLDIERRLGVQATYFVMVRSTAYNLFCIESLRMVDHIRNDGHSIGLHFMGELCEGESAQLLCEKVLREADWLEAEFQTRISAVSFHQPSRAVLEGDLDIPNLYNTYNRNQMRLYVYVSDTNMKWQHEHPIEIFSRVIYRRLQLLIHPMWWTKSKLNTREKWHAVLDGNRKAVLSHWAERERTLNGINIFSAD